MERERDPDAPLSRRARRREADRKERRDRQRRRAPSRDLGSVRDGLARRPVLRARERETGRAGVRRPENRPLAFRRARDARPLSRRPSARDGRRRRLGAGAGRRATPPPRDARHVSVAAFSRPPRAAAPRPARAHDRGRHGALTGAPGRAILLFFAVRSSAVGVAQSVERRIVVPNVAGSNPVSHPSFFGPRMRP